MFWHGWKKVYIQEIIPENGRKREIIRFSRGVIQKTMPEEIGYPPAYLKRDPL
jgi:hypothetical protein